MNISDLRKKADSGNVVAQTVLGTCYLDGTEVEIDHSEAFRLLSLAADRGAARAMVSLARIYMEGLGVSKDLAEGIRWYERASRGGEFIAQIQLGRIYSQGKLRPANERLALEYYKAAVDQEAAVDEPGAIAEAKAYISRRENYK
jgi:TPR repeat protein